ncbi:hypothetical protein DPMN_191592 [Dreissena polymorpha]|uniref:Uncharacterized protein n=1 Tax=Dreissena polymorpha TaxID=45954 RepID=A0A9D4BEL0_DREPO|nr:hypothetical protein DPMN_191592 [Dreissena polymorpha]
MPKDLEGEEVAHGVDQVTGYTYTEIGQTQVVRELPQHQSNLSSQQSHATHRP